MKQHSACWVRKASQKNSLNPGVHIFFSLFLIKKATKFCEIFPLLLSTVHTDKSKGKIFQNFVAFSEYMNFKYKASFLELLKKIISKKIPLILTHERVKLWP